MNKRILYSLASALPLVVPLATAAEAGHQHEADETRWHESSPLVQKVRKATARFRDINVAVAEGYSAGRPA